MFVCACVFVCTCICVSTDHTIGSLLYICVRMICIVLDLLYAYWTKCCTKECKDLSHFHSSCIQSKWSVSPRPLILSMNLLRPVKWRQNVKTKSVVNNSCKLHREIYNKQMMSVIYFEFPSSHEDSKTLRVRLYRDNTGFQSNCKNVKSESKKSEILKCLWHG